MASAWVQSNRDNTTTLAPVHIDARLHALQGEGHTVQRQVEELTRPERLAQWALANNFTQQRWCLVRNQSVVPHAEVTPASVRVGAVVQLNPSCQAPGAGAVSKGEAPTKAGLSMRGVIVAVLGPSTVSVRWDRARRQAAVREGAMPGVLAPSDALYDIHQIGNKERSLVYSEDQSPVSDAVSLLRARAPQAKDTRKTAQRLSAAQAEIERMSTVITRLRRGDASGEEETAAVVDVARLRRNVSVSRGPDWQWSDQDGASGQGVVQGECQDKQGWVNVRWESGETNSYRAGYQHRYDLVYSDGCVTRTIDWDHIRCGLYVERGTDWEWENQDGGAGSKGLLLRRDQERGWAWVQWGKESINRYRVGHESKHDVQYCSPVPTAVPRPSPYINALRTEVQALLGHVHDLSRKLKAISTELYTRASRQAEGPTPGANQGQQMGVQRERATGYKGVVYPYDAVVTMDNLVSGGRVMRGPDWNEMYVGIDIGIAYRKEIRCSHCKMCVVHYTEEEVEDCYDEWEYRLDGFQCK
ncbi:hypothetical protein KIPB_001214, partial [Kipferlia bialata]|eukprot:g1214.t1